MPKKNSKINLEINTESDRMKNLSGCNHRVIISYNDLIEFLLAMTKFSYQNYYLKKNSYQKNNFKDKYCTIIYFMKNSTYKYGWYLGCFSNFNIRFFW